MTSLQHNKKTKSSSKRVRRKLATVLAADVASFSAMVSESEEATIRALRSARRIFDQRIEEHNGRIANTAGDSVIAVFDSPVEAARCAVEVQTLLSSKTHSSRMKNSNSRESRVQFRIGLHLGDVLLNGKDVLGDAVNIAARLEAVSSPGAVCFTTIMKEQIGNRMPDHQITYVGEKELKNIPTPVSVYEMLSPHAKRVEKESKKTKDRRFAIILLCAIFIISGAAGLGIMSARSLLFVANNNIEINNTKQAISEKINREKENERTEEESNSKNGEGKAD